MLYLHGNLDLIQFSFFVGSKIMQATGFKVVKPGGYSPSGCCMWDCPSALETCRIATLHQ